MKKSMIGQIRRPFFSRDQKSVDHATINKCITVDSINENGVGFHRSLATGLAESVDKFHPVIALVVCYLFAFVSTVSRYLRET